MKCCLYLLFLLPAVVCSSCFTSKFSYHQMESIRYGMSSKELIAVMGKPNFRSFNEKGEKLEFRENEYTTSKVVCVWLVDDKVVEMQSYLDRREECRDNDKNKNATDKKSETPTVHVTSDGKHVVQMGTIIVTPDGKHIHTH